MIEQPEARMRSTYITSTWLRREGNDREVRPFPHADTALLLLCTSNRCELVCTDAHTGTHSHHNTWDLHTAHSTLLGGDATAAASDSTQRTAAT